jgi:predicted RNase H-like HicB family nuclease
MTDPNTWTAVFKRDPAGMWLVELVEEPRVHTYGRTLAKARANIADAAALWFEIDVGEVRLVEDIGLPARVGANVKRARQGRQRADVAQAKAAADTRSAAHALVRDAHLSVRDAADVLGLSYQRVQQLVGSTADTGADARPSSATAQPRGRHSRQRASYLDGEHEGTLTASQGARRVR